MRITTRLTIVTVATMTALVVLTPVLLWAVNDFQHARDDYLLADSIQANFFERAAYRDQYFLFREARARIQWEDNKKVSDLLLAQAKRQFYRQEDQRTLAQLQQSIEDVADLFHRVVANSDRIRAASGNRVVQEELEKRLYSQLLRKASAVREAVTELRRTGVQRAEYSYGRLISIVGLFAVSLTLALLLTALQISQLMRRRLAPLHAGATAVAGGNLTHRIATDANDEFAELATSINAMTSSLQTSTRALELEIAQRAQAQAALQESEFRWKFAIEGAGDGLWDWSVPDGTVFYSKTWKSMLGYSEDEIGNQLAEWDKRVHPEDKAATLQAVQAHLDGKTPIYVNEHRVLCKNGSYKWVLDRGLVVRRSADGNPLRVIGTHSDISERKQLEEQVRQLAFYDPLTHLPNRRLLNDRLSQAMAGSSRCGKYGALMILDLDNFKPLNDTHGHVMGDLLLLEVANRLKTCVRETDTVARFGGDEFVVILGELDADRAESLHQAGLVAEKIRLALSAPYLLNHTSANSGGGPVEHRCSASIGVTLFGDREESRDDIFMAADSAMYQAKEGGRNRIRFYQTDAGDAGHCPELPSAALLGHSPHPL